MQRAKSPASYRRILTGSRMRGARGANRGSSDGAEADNGGRDPGLRGAPRRRIRAVDQPLRGKPRMGVHGNSVKADNEVARCPTIVRAVVWYETEQPVAVASTGVRFDPARSRMTIAFTDAHLDPPRGSDPCAAAGLAKSDPRPGASPRTPLRAGISDVHRAVLWTRPIP